MLFVICYLVLLVFRYLAGEASRVSHRINSILYVVSGNLISPSNVSLFFCTRTHEHSLGYYFFGISRVRKWRLAKCPAWEYHYVVLVTIPQNCPSKKRSKIAGAHHR